MVLIRGMLRELLVLVCLMLISTSVAGATATNESDVVITVDSSSLRFSPSEVTLTEGQAVRFMWSGQALPHNAVAVDGLFESGEPARDVDYRFVFEVGTAGTHAFVCEPHESVGMVGTITVEAAPVEVVEEIEEELPVENTPSVSFMSSIIVTTFAAAFAARRTE